MQGSTETILCFGFVFELREQEQPPRLPACLPADVAGVGCVGLPLVTCL